MNSEYKAVLQSVEDELPFQITWYDVLESLLSIDKFYFRNCCKYES